MFTFLFFCLLLICFSLESENHDVTFIIISQNSEHNDKLANQLENSLKEQSRDLRLNDPEVYISNKHFAKTPAAWTIIPLIVPILRVLTRNTGWVIFLEDRTSVVLKTLLESLEKYDPAQEIWIGHASHDAEATIIHHFAFFEDPKFFKYPNFGSGMALSVPLIKRLKLRVETGFKELDFHIDPAHEFALFAFDDGNGTMIRHDNSFCSTEGPNCATYPKNDLISCGHADIASIFFAIKTCQKFHNDRVKVVKKTWHKYAEKSNFFSDIDDGEIPTKSLGVPSTQQGHCQKTIAILQYGLKEFDLDDKLQWLALVDDDTILSVSRLASLIGCHKNSSQPLILGERYRFGARGFDYPTGGAGILINKVALKILAQSCKCPGPDSPDDMVLGACAQELGVVVVHIHQMHQARPTDYAPGRLAPNDAVSFHKHWMIDPIKTYEEWFSTDDQTFFKARDRVKSEL